MKKVLPCPEKAWQHFVDTLVTKKPLVLLGVGKKAYSKNKNLHVRMVMV